MEKPPQLENKSLRERLVGALIKSKEAGSLSAEAQKLLDRWTQDMERKTPNKQPERNKAVILLNIERARLYKDAGFHQEALENYEAALTQLGNEGDRDFADKTGEVVYAEMDSIESS